MVIVLWDQLTLVPSIIHRSIPVKVMVKNATIIVLDDEDRLEFLFKTAFSFGLNGRRTLIISQPINNLVGIDNETYKLKPFVLEMIQIRFAQNVAEVIEYCHNNLLRKPSLPDSIFLNGLETFLNVTDPHVSQQAYSLCCALIDAWMKCSEMLHLSKNDSQPRRTLVVAVNAKTLECVPAFSQLFSSIVCKADAMKLFKLPH